MTWASRAMALGATGAALAALSLMASPLASADVDDWAPRDTYGIPITEYRLSFNNGAGILGPLFTPDTTGPAAFAYILFGIFLAAAWIGFMALNILLKADWLSPLVRVIDGTANRLYEQLGLPFILFAVTVTLMITGAIWSMRNQVHRIWHHIAVTVVCVIIGASIAFPVAEAAKLLGIGRDAAVESGQSLVGGSARTPDPNNPTGVLVDEWVRKPVQRWIFGGQDLDSLGCAEQYNAAIRAHQPDKIKDVPITCLGEERGKPLHDAAMNPQNTIVDSILTTLFGVVLCGLLLFVVAKVLGVSVVSLIHAGLVKVGLMGAGTSGGQNFLIRNGVDAPIAGVMFFAGLLGVFIGADVAKILAQVVPSSKGGMALTILLLVSTGMGIRQVIRNLRLTRNRVARTATRGSGSGSALQRPGISGARVLAAAAATRYATQRARRTVKALAAPQAAVPSALAAKVRASAQRAGQLTSTAASTAGGGGSGSAPAYATATSASTGAAPQGGWYPPQTLSPAQYARAAAAQYRANRAAVYMPTGNAPRVAGRPAPSTRAAAMAAAGVPGSGPQSQGGGAGGPRPSGSAPQTVPSPPPRTQGGAGAIRSGGGTASAARNTARAYRGQRKP
ncbi:Uncharacterised protein [Mycobacteroides abscessus subsp. abscessus]|uniref:hypothetical protein n=1 Tax=Mycobacteroides abscessus TaxID=36809 RepID=UPI0009A905D5|nr:hypothetical protein [Mycobacteroides abscessus]SKO34294.1 Uncharacterised protein [Mycobacteroides abscessus subsp. abscessus]